MTPYVLTHAAQADMESVRDYFADYTTDYGLKLVRKIYEQFDHIANHPRTGTPKLRLSKGLFQRNVSNYLVFYFIRDDRIEIVRVVDGRRKITRKLLFGPRI